MKKPKLLKHYTGPGRNDYVFVRKAGITPVRFIGVLRRVFPNLEFHDPHLKGMPQNPIYVCGSTFGTPLVYVRKFKGGRFRGVALPVRLSRGGEILSRADVGTWYRCLREVYTDLGLGLHLEDLIHHLHCLDAGGKLARAEVRAAINWVTKLYSQES